MARKADPVSVADYRDTGCRFAPACLSCPFETCLEEGSASALAELRAMRDDLIRRAFAAGYPAHELGRRFELSAGRVYAIVREGACAA